MRSSALNGVTRLLRRGSLGVVLAGLAFGIYASVVLLAPQLRDTPHCCEEASLAAAVSNVLYGAPLGSLYSGVYQFFLTHDKEPEPPTLAAVRNGDALPATPPGAWIPTTRDGNGIGYPLVLTAAFRLFGLHAWAPLLIMLMLMAASTIAFLWRFSGAYAPVPILYFTCLTVMLFTPWFGTRISRPTRPLAGFAISRWSASCPSSTSC